ncbi:MauE/DoxX family redox-associated membrane protein [Pontibacter virosus]|uniref:Methylamine utilization protein MauE n=1 Tax=Pontibacter virosus TaxID=1765052 RepID=A0A2U1B4X6_9BACT|nr:MauE/DoxX family redox-associated membrane protein [Pontibacter virosus]PVY43652.1 methylamine utilization protein MauE [Pontibacter virosus]
MNKKLVIEGITALLILLFLYTALSKLLDLQAFRGQLVLQPFPAGWESVLLWALPLTELLACTLLFFPRTRLQGLYLASLLMSVFTLYVALVLTRAFGYIPCSCGGVLERMNWETHLVFNVVFLALAITATILHKRSDQQALHVQTTAGLFNGKEGSGRE